MKYKAKILVTAGGGGVGQSIIKAIKLANVRYGRDYKIYTTDIRPLSAGLFRVEKGFLVPPASSPDYVDKLLNIAQSEGVQVLIPGSDPELPVLAENKREFANDGIIPLVGEPQSVKIGYDKWRTFEFLKENGFNYPETALPENVNALVEKVGFPLLIKPRYGSGSVGINVARDEEELRFFMSRIEEPIVQEYIEGEEYTTGVLIDKDGDLVGSITLKRELKKGSTFRAVIDDFKDVRKAAEKIALKTGLIGPVNIQMRMTEMGPITFEINPRFSGTTVVRAYAEFNEPDIMIRNLLYDEKVFNVNYRKGIAMVRYLNELFVEVEKLSELEKSGWIRYSGEIYEWF
ncbi:MULTISPECIES: ATP-grasp domain-containing protein [unclassified Archaeoglobus]|jgi:carbamoyl-phosphate synthase large subunit|uniref:ATP-grasp domain-containing protein n=1 Tax=unclassified Archaeoglobus TaxID=2643606 RepID=UPI0025BA2437|nr:MULTISPECIES: ATP-grasp domain-containing protein [unclassified Archaeoglobus]